jgi:hypothetical protein
MGLYMANEFMKAQVIGAGVDPLLIIVTPGVQPKTGFCLSARKAQPGLDFRFKGCQDFPGAGYLCCCPARSRAAY